MSTEKVQEKEGMNLPSCYPVLKESGLSVDKQNEIIKLLSTIEEKSKEWKTLSAIEVVDHNDIKAIKKANENRGIIKRERKEMERFLKSLREKVQEKMDEFKKEDTAYLRLFQYYEKVAKEEEAILEEKEETRIRYEAEQKRLLKESRTQKLTEVCDHPEMYPLTEMNEEAFNNLYEGLFLQRKKAEEDRLAEEEAEKERLAELSRLAELRRQRSAIIAPFAKYMEPWEYGMDFSGLTEEEFNEIVERVTVIKSKKDTFKARREEMSPYALLEYEGKGTITIETSEEDYKKVLANAKASFEKREKELDDLKKQKEEQEKEEARVNAMKSKLFSLGMKFDGENFTFDTVKLNATGIAKWSDADFQETYATTSGLISDRKAVLNKEAADRKAELDRLAALPKKEEVAPPREELTPKEYLANWLERFIIPDYNIQKSPEVNAKHTEIMTKFAGFTKWAKKEISALK